MVLRSAVELGRCVRVVVMNAVGETGIKVNAVRREDSSGSRNMVEHARAKGRQ